LLEEITSTVVDLRGVNDLRQAQQDGDEVSCGKDECARLCDAAELDQSAACDLGNSHGEDNVMRVETENGRGSALPFYCLSRTRD
jgi:hypothetical protein